MSTGFGSNQNLTATMIIGVIVVAMIVGYILALVPFWAKTILILIGIGVLFQLYKYIKNL